MSQEIPVMRTEQEISGRKWVNKTEGQKIIPMKQSKGLRLHLTEN